MKKFLSLVLALVMTMSLVTVGAGAADFTDDSSITYEEAVDVMTALGVVGGYADGSFGPKGTLTRGAAAKIICNLILGTTTADALAADSAPYSDVPVDNVFAGYIAYLAKANVIGGYADGTFRPAATLTGYAFMKMLLGVIGLDASIEGYTGANWSIAVAKRALSEDVDLTNGLVGEFNGTKAVTREEACLYAFNAIKAVKFTYENKSTLVVGDIKVSSTSEASQKGNAVYYTDVFPKLSATTTFDNLGHPATKWDYKTETVGTYAKAADETYVLTDTYAIGADDDYASLLAVLQDEDFTDNSGLFYSTMKDYKGKRVFVNGVGVISSDGAVVAAMKNTAKGGVTVELYYNDDDKDAVDYVTILNYSIDEIEDASTKLTASQKEDGATSKIKVDSVWYLDNEVVGFDEDTYVEDAYLLYIEKDGELVASQIAEVVEGKVTAKQSTKVKIDGTYYKNVSGETISVGDKGSYYLSIAGQIAKVDATSSTSENYAYIYNVKVTEGVNDDGVNATTFKVFYVAADGTKGSAIAATDVDDGTYYFEDTEVEINGKFTGVVAYSINSDGEFVYEEAEDDISEKTTGAISKTSANGTDSDTKFIFTWTKGSTQKVATKVGYKNVNINNSDDYYTVTDDDDDVLYVFVLADNDDVESDAALAVLLDTDAVEEENEDGDATYTYAVAIDGEETTLTFEDELDDYKAGSVFAYVMDGDYAEIDDATIYGMDTDTTVAKATSTYIMVSTTQLNITDDTTVYTVTVEYKASADVETDADSFDPADHYDDIKSVDVAEGGKISKDDYVVYTLDDSDLDVVFVYEFVG